MLKRDSARAPSWAAAVMISGAEATFFTGPGDHFRPSAPWSGHGQVSGSPGEGGRLEAQDWGEGWGVYFLEIRFRSLVNSVCDLRECDGWPAPGVIRCEAMSESTTANSPFLCSCFMFMILMIRLRKEMKRSHRSRGLCTLHYWWSLRWTVEMHSRAIPSSDDIFFPLRSWDIVRINFMRRFPALDFTSFTRSRLFFNWHFFLM